MADEKIRNQHTLEIIAKNIKHFRVLKNISQTELGLQADITPSYVTDIENCRHDILVSTLTSIAFALDIKVSELLNEDREEYLTKPRIDKK